MTNAERQAHYRARHAAVLPAAFDRTPPDPANRSTQPPKRWQDAVNELLTLQAEYAGWLAVLPESLNDSPTTQTLGSTVELDLDS